MFKYFVTAFLLVIIGSVLSNAFKTTQLREESVLIRPRRETLEEPQEIKIDGKDAAEGNNQGLIATYWNNFLKRARLPVPSWNITNPLSNLFTPYVVEVDYPPENSQPQQINAQAQQMNAQPHLILVDPATQQYYKVQPVSS